MANLSKHKFISGSIAFDFNNLVSISSKLKRIAASVAFLKKLLHQEVTQFTTKRDKWKCRKVERVMLLHLQDHKNTLKSLIKERNTLLINLINNYWNRFCNIITNCLMKRLRESRMVSLKAKNKKLRRLIEIKQQLPQHNQVPIVNLTKYIFNNCGKITIRTWVRIWLYKQE